MERYSGLIGLQNKYKYQNGLVFNFGVRQQLLSSINQTGRRLTVSIRYLYNYNEPLYNAEQRLRLNKQFKLYITSMYKLSLHIICTPYVLL